MLLIEQEIKKDLHKIFDINEETVANAGGTSPKKGDLITVDATKYVSDLEKEVELLQKEAKLPVDQRSVNVTKSKFGGFQLTKKDGSPYNSSLVQAQSQGGATQGNSNQGTTQGQGNSAQNNISNIPVDKIKQFILDIGSKNIKNILNLSAADKKKIKQMISNLLAGNMNTVPSPTAPPVNPTASPTKKGIPESNNISLLENLFVLLDADENKNNKLINESISRLQNDIDIEEKRMPKPAKPAAPAPIPTPTPAPAPAGPDLLPDYLKQKESELSAFEDAYKKVNIDFTKHKFLADVVSTDDTKKTATVKILLTTTRDSNGNSKIKDTGVQLVIPYSISKVTKQAQDRGFKTAAGTVNNIKGAANKVGNFLFGK